MDALDQVRLWAPDQSWLSPRGGGGGQVYDHWARLESRADREGHGPWNTSHRGLKCRQLGSAQPWARHLTLSAKS